MSRKKVRKVFVGLWLSGDDYDKYLEAKTRYGRQLSNSHLVRVAFRLGVEQMFEDFEALLHSGKLDEEWRHHCNVCSEPGHNSRTCPYGVSGK